MSDGLEFEISAALLRRGQSSVGLVEELGARLQRALPTRVEVEKAGWMSRRHLQSLLVELSPEHFRIVVERRRLTAWIDHVIRGVCIRSDEVTLDEWLERLASALSKEAQRSVEVRLALEEAMR